MTDSSQNIRNNMQTYFLGENLRKIRKLHERKQTDIANCIGISTRQYRKMENDEVPIKAQYLKKLAECYGLPTAIIIGFDESRLLNKMNLNSEKPNLDHDTKEKDSDAMHEFYEKIIHAKDTVIQSQRELIDVLKNKTSNHSIP